MARIAGVDIPNEKRVVISLTYIYGIGRNLSKTILNNANVDVNKKAKDLGVPIISEDTFIQMFGRS